MRIGDETLDAAFQRFGERQWTDKSVRKLVSFVVDREIDYEAATLNRHRYGRPKCYEGLDSFDCNCRRQVTSDIDAALGIGGDDE